MCFQQLLSLVFVLVRRTALEANLGTMKNEQEVLKRMLKKPSDIKIKGAGANAADLHELDCVQHHLSP